MSTRVIAELAAKRVAQGGEPGQAERLAAHARIEPAGGDGRGGARLVTAGHAGRERVDERLAALIERRAHDGEQQCGGTSKSSSGSACHWTNTVSAP